VGVYEKALVRQEDIDYKMREMDDNIFVRFYCVYCRLKSGGMINSQRLSETIQSHINSMAKVRFYPGEFEMRVLAKGVLQVLP